MREMGPLSIRNVGDYIREQRRSAQVSLRQLARLAGVSNPYLSQIERGLRKPSAEILQQIAKGLRISAEQLYIQAGFLDERLGDTEVVTAILADAGLTERQKQVLLEIYESFRKENAIRASPAEAADDDAPAEAADAAATPAKPGQSTALHPVEPVDAGEPAAPAATEAPEPPVGAAGPGEATRSA